MTGTLSYRSIRRLRGVGRTLFALGAALLLVAALAPFAFAVSSASDDRATLVPGNFTDANCETTDSLYVSPTAGASDDYVTAVVSTADVSTTVGGDPVTYLGAHVLNVTAEPGVVVSAISVKGSESYNLYDGIYPNMISPIAGGSGEPAQISHYTICYDVVPDLTLDKSGPESALHDETFSYTLTVGNAGAADTGAITVVDTLPSSVTFDSASPEGCSYDGTEAHTVTCELGSLAPGGSHEITITVTVSTTDCAPFTNSASASEDAIDDSAQDSVDTSIPASECETTTEDANPVVAVQKLVSLNGTDFTDANSTPGATFALGIDDTQQVWFRIIVTNESKDGTVLDVTSLTDTVDQGIASELNLSGCDLPDALAPGASSTCDVGPVIVDDEAVGDQHRNTVSVSATGGGETVLATDPAHYLATAAVGGVVVERPPPPAPPPAPPVAEPEPAPEVLAEELPRTGPENLWLAGFALMLIGAGLLTIARGRSMERPAVVSGTWWTRQR